MVEKQVSLRDPQLNSQLPSYSITRRWVEENSHIFGMNEDDTQIPRNYWENAIAVKGYLEKLHGLKILTPILQDSQLFQKLIIKLHLQQTLGIRRNKHYQGTTLSDEVLQPNWESHFRSPQAKIFATTDFNLSRKILESCIKFDSRSWFDTHRHLKDYAEVSEVFENEVFTSSVDLYIPPSLFQPEILTREVLNQSLEEYVALETPICQERKSIIAIFIHPAFANGNTEKTNLDSTQKIIQVLFPSVGFIFEYLELMRKNLLFACTNRTATEKVIAVARAYQAGIRSQAFDSVWNSEMMGVINFFLEDLLDLQRIPHADLDYLAFLLSPTAFEKYFYIFVNRFNENLTT